jgi:hypothetical protein
VAPALIPPPAAGGASRPSRPRAEITVEGDTLVLSVLGRFPQLLAMKRQVRVPLQSVVSIAHDPLAEAKIPTRIRTADAFKSPTAGSAGTGRRRHRASSTTSARPGKLFRYGTYHSFLGWSFWAVGFGDNIVVIELSGARFRHLVAEVADPVAVIALVREAQQDRGRRHEAEERTPGEDRTPGEERDDT